MGPGPRSRLGKKMPRGAHCAAPPPSTAAGRFQEARPAPGATPIAADPGGDGKRPPRSGGGRGG